MLLAEPIERRWQSQDPDQRPPHLLVLLALYCTGITGIRQLQQELWGMKACPSFSETGLRRVIQDLEAAGKLRAGVEMGVQLWSLRGDWA